MKLSISSAAADHPLKDDALVLAGKRFTSRLLVGTGKYKNAAEAQTSIAISGAEIITMAVRRVDLKNPQMLQDHFDPKKFTYLPNSAGCYTAEESVRMLELAREIGGWKMIKLEVIGDKKTLYPDMDETLKATALLVKEGFEVLAYITDEPLWAKKIEDAGAVAVMPLGAPIGSGQGILRPKNITQIVHNARVPVILDAGLGTASDAAFAMELGCAAVLLNSAIAHAKNPILMATAMKHAVIAGRQAFLAGRMPKREAEASSPTEGLI